MAKKKEISEAELESLHAKIQARKKAIFTELLTKINADGALDNLDSVASLLDDAGRKEETLSRVNGTIGEIMRQRALQNRAASKKG